MISNFHQAKIKTLYNPKWEKKSMQVSLIDMPKREKFEDQVILKYSWKKDAGDDSLDIEMYGRSLLGFGKVYKKITKQFLEANIEVRVVAEKEGSLETIAVRLRTFGIRGFPRERIFYERVPFYGHA